MIEESDIVTEVSFRFNDDFVNSLYMLCPSKEIVFNKETNKISCKISMNRDIYNKKVIDLKSDILNLISNFLNSEDCNAISNKKLKTIYVNSNLILSQYDIEILKFIEQNFKDQQFKILDVCDKSDGKFDERHVWKLLSLYVSFYSDIILVGKESSKGSPRIYKYVGMDKETKT